MNIFGVTSQNVEATEESDFHSVVQLTVQSLVSALDGQEVEGAQMISDLDAAPALALLRLL